MDSPSVSLPVLESDSDSFVSRKLQSNLSTFDQSSMGLRSRDYRKKALINDGGSSFIIKLEKENVMLLKQNSELIDQLESLAVQLKTAATSKHVTDSNELNRIFYETQFTELQNQVQKLKDENKDLRDSCESAQAANVNVETEATKKIETLKKQLTIMEDRNNDFKSKITELLNDAEVLQEKLVSAVNTINTSESKISLLQEKLSCERINTDQLGKEKINLKSENVSLVEKVERLSKDIRSIKQSNFILSKRSKASEVKVDETSKENIELNNIISSLTNSNIKIKSQLKLTEKKLSTLKQELISANKRITENNSHLRTHLLDIVSMTLSSNNSIETRGVIHKPNDDFFVENGATSGNSSSKHNYEVIIADLKFRLVTAEADLERLIKTTKESEAKKEKLEMPVISVEAFDELRSDLQSFINEKFESNSNDTVQGKSVVERLAQQILRELDVLNQAVNSKFNIVESQLVESDLQRTSLQAKLSSSQNEVLVLNKKVDSSSKKIKELENSLSSSRTFCRKLQTDLTSSKSKCDSNIEEINKLKSIIDTYQSQIADGEESIKGAEKVIIDTQRSAKTQQKILMDQCSEFQAEIHKLQSILDTKNSHTKHLEETIDELKREIMFKTKEIDSFAVKNQELLEFLKNAEAQQKLTSQDLSEASNRNTTIIKDFETKYQTLKDDLQAARLQLKKVKIKSRSDAQEFKERLASITKKHKASEKNLSEQLSLEKSEMERCQKRHTEQLSQITKKFNDEKKSEIERMNEMIGEKNDLIQKLQRELVQAREAETASHILVQRLQQDCDHYELSSKKEKMESQQLMSRLSEMEQELRYRENEITARTDQLARLESALRGQQNEGNQKVRSIEQKLMEREKIISEIEDHLKTESTKNTQLVKENRDLLASVQNISGELTSSRSECESWRKVCSQLRAELNEMRIFGDKEEKTTLNGLSVPAKS